MAIQGPFQAGNERPCHSIAWACVYTHPQAERWANDNLRQAGYVTCLPLMQVRRRDRVITSLWHTVEVPLFSRYLFICFDALAESWSPIRAAPGVRDLVRNGDEVAYTPDAVVARLQAVQALPPPATPWAPGTPCTLAEGPFKGHAGVVIEQRGQTALVAVLLFGALRPLHAPLASLRARE